MLAQLRADEAPGGSGSGVLGDSDTRALRRVYASARQAICERIAMDEEIERRLAIVVLFTYSAERSDDPELADEGDMIARCVARLMAQTSVEAPGAYDPPERRPAREENAARPGLVRQRWR